jgi:hypothetical protein
MQQLKNSLPFDLTIRERRTILSPTMQQRIKICALCGSEIHGLGATSRKDNKTKICVQCALIEAWHDYTLWEQAKLPKLTH